MQRTQTCVLGGEASTAGDVDHQADLALELAERHLLAGDGRHGEVMESGHGGHGTVCPVGERITIAELIEQARSGLTRLTPAELCEALGRPETVVLDTRTPTDRERFGCIPGAIHTPRTRIEFMADPEWGYRHEAIEGFDQLLVVVCNGGYSSSLAARTLQRIGFGRATDLIGGMEAWRAAGMPLVPPDHHAL